MSWHRLRPMIGTVLVAGTAMAGYVLLWFLMVPGQPWLFMLALPFFSFGIGGLFTLMMSMTADVCDLDELATGKRREGIFGAIYWWMVKFGFAIAGEDRKFVWAQAEIQGQTVVVSAATCEVMKEARRSSLRSSMPFSSTTSGLR